MAPSMFSRGVKAFLSAYREGLEMACPVRNAASEAIRQVNVACADIDRKLADTADRYRGKIRRRKGRDET